MNSIQLTKTINDNDLNNEASGRRKNQKHQKFYAIFVNKKLINEKDPLFSNDPYVMQEAISEFSAFIEEAVASGCNSLFSERKQRFVFWKSDPWELGPVLKEHGVKLTIIGNRMADYEALVQEATRRKRSGNEALEDFLAAQVNLKKQN